MLTILKKFVIWQNAKYIKFLFSIFFWGMEKSAVRFDQAIIVDNYLPRIDQIAGHLIRTRTADSIEKILVDRTAPFEHIAYYNQIIKETLADHKRLLVVYNFYAALRNGFLYQLQLSEQETGREAAKRMIISCISRDKIRGALNRFGASQVEIVQYNKNEGVSTADLELALGELPLEKSEPSWNKVTRKTKECYNN